jgi:membrane-associated phospholipid phosphatase
MFGLSWLGFDPEDWVITTAVIVFLFLVALRWEALVVLVSVIGNTVLGLTIKVIVDRPRPAADLVTVVNQLHDYSFPSGHVLYFTTFVGFLVFLTYTLVKPTWWRTVLLILLGGMVALIGLSRVYEGQHWASDVIASYLLGSVWLSLSILIYNWGKPRYFTRAAAAPFPAAGDTGEPAHSSSYRG